MATQSTRASADSPPADLPSGHCTYLLNDPGLQGQRCACVGFTRNRNLPGAFCQCGHLPCFHHQSPRDKTEAEKLQRRIQFLECKDRENHDDTRVTQRLVNLEELFDSSKYEHGLEMRGYYQNVNRLWQTVYQLEKKQAGYEGRLVQYDERLDGHEDTLQRLGDRLVDVDEASMALEERVEALEEHDITEAPPRRHRRRSTSESEQSRNSRWVTTQRPRQSGHFGPKTGPSSTASSQTHGPGLGRVIGAQGRMAGSWTVHVSLLPMASQPFPFEKDTNAYKRCLSRGLHKIVVVADTDSESFVRAVSQTFGHLLQGRPWVPLQARLCDAKNLEDQPMLRPLDGSLAGAQYDYEFLRDYCALCSRNGKIESLYIAMRADTLSWHFLRQAPVFMGGLEASWEYDALLDPDEGWSDDSDDERQRPSAGEITSLKRPASEMSQSQSQSQASMAGFSAPAGMDSPENSRTKLPRTTCIQTPMKVRRRGVETA
ncbi:hypothetical protein F4780DRAFT_665526 [Xylariomycetidae sp. FL0641]|nr:hypothetical protein F4780DRAFT_665526 [Xylariomycetidae sp. FL0641]